MGSGSAKPSKHQIFCSYKHEAAVNFLFASEDGTVLLTGSDDCTARLWSSNTTPIECLGVFTGHLKYVSCGCMIGESIVTGSADKTVRVWDMGTCECLMKLEGHTSSINAVIAVGEYVYSSSLDKTVRAWLIKKKRGCDSCVRIFQGHTLAVTSLVYVPPDDDVYQGTAEEIIISGSADCTARSWSIAKGTMLKMFKGHTGAVACMHVSEDFKVLFTGGGDGRIRSWNIRKGMPITIFEGHTSGIMAIALTSKVLYTASVDKTARSWVIEFGTCTQYYRKHKHTVNTIIYFNGFVFTACGDGVIRCYDAKTGFVKRFFRGHSLAVTAIKIASNRLFTTSVDQTVRAWSLNNLKDDAGMNILDCKVQVQPKKEDEMVNYVKRNPISGAPEVMLHGVRTQIMLDNPHPYDEQAMEELRADNQEEE